ncbi:MAG TPA: CinA family protein [Intrasporangium sp.]|uniref:CinA family protein n=1 Tax=Intrasporangium sp. TaxID=1925024 RepID=UPI002D792D84|nr:CinA family protein [Intrasporangium sp.]HET7397938.1 CinA family protein [Intrasporangium sp.]
METSGRIVRHLTGLGQTVACAESLTAGLVAAALADVPGASLVLRGAVVAYAADLKVALLGVDPGLLERVGTVDPAVAAAMASGARTRLGATWGLATTGVAGPGPAEGKPAGTVDIAVAGPAGIRTERLRLQGSRAHVRAAAVRQLLDLAATQMGVPPGASGTRPGVG